MSHSDAILEQALAELAELSRRVADLTATVSGLTKHGGSGFLDGLIKVITAILRGAFTAEKGRGALETKER